MKKLLIISPFLPYPLNSGGNQAQYHMIERLRDSIQISFLFPFKSSDTNGLVHLKEKWSNITFFPFIEKKNISFYISRITLILKEWAIYGNKRHVSTISSDLYYTNAFLKFVDDIVRDGKFDIIQTEFYYYLPLIYMLPKTVKRIFIQHEILFVVNGIMKEMLSGEKMSLAYEKYMLEKTKNEEIAAMNAYDAVLTLTQLDMNKIIENGVNVPVYASPAGIEMPSDRKYSDFANKLVFVGGFGHPPNVVSLNWFLENIWGGVSQQFPSLKFNIIGNWPDRFIKNIYAKYNNICFKGFVPDLKPEFSGAISVVPIIIGSGMRMKIIDAANYGTPFITTSIGVEGLDFIDQRDCFIADTVGEFTDKLIQLINDETIRRHFYENSFNVLSQKYSLTQLSDLRYSIYNQVMQTKG